MSAQLIHGLLTQSVIGAFYEVYNTLGFGFLEGVYSSAMERELMLRGHTVEREVQVRVRYKGAELATQRLDMVVENKLLLEVKSTSLRRLPPNARCTTTCVGQAWRSASCCISVRSPASTGL